ncbi:COP23 domain-containing protein [Fortiea contorta]|uniref:COP23 domain-containing protein n=1 Tax=Fortiea contorta TaxID=1892405 RepID=UPI000348C3D7|nr:COP23 domain-containing protein [Fortiea contorta]
MLTNFSSKLLTANLCFISIILLLTNQIGLSQTPPVKSNVKTAFLCIRQGSGYATVARRGTKTTSPIITWNDTAFGPQFAPEERCKRVSQRLTTAFASRAGDAGTLKITHGIYNSNPVICYIKTEKEKCSGENLLLTLNSSERGQEKEILNQLLNFSVKGTSTPLRRDESDRTVLELGIQLNKAFADDSATPPLTPKN